MHNIQTEPFWLDIMPGVRVLFAPITRSAVRDARLAAGEALVEAGDAPKAAALAGDAFSEALLRAGLRGWEGIGDDEGVPLGFSSEAVSLVLSEPILFEAVDRAYVGPFVSRDQEKNVSAPSPNGSSAGATGGRPTAPTAPASARTVPAKSTAPKRPRVKGSGT